MTVKCDFKMQGKGPGVIDPCGEKAEQFLLTWNGSHLSARCRSHRIRGVSVTDRPDIVVITEQEAEALSIHEE
jgi:hypothetical protein